MASRCVWHNNELLRGSRWSASALAHVASLCAINPSPAALFYAGVTQLQAARVAMAASQRLVAAPSFSAPAAPSYTAGFTSAPSMPGSFAASGLLSGSSSSGELHYQVVQQGLRYAVCVQAMLSVLWLQARVNNFACRSGEVWYGGRAVHDRAIRPVLHAEYVCKALRTCYDIGLSKERLRA